MEPASNSNQDPRSGMIRLVDFLSSGTQLMAKVRTGASLDLNDHGSFNAIDDELTSTDHLGDLADKNFLFNGVSVFNLSSTLIRATVGEPQVATILHVADEVNTVTDVLQSHLPSCER